MSGPTRRPVRHGPVDGLPAATPELSPAAAMGLPLSGLLRVLFDAMYGPSGSRLGVGLTYNNLRYFVWGEVEGPAVDDTTIYSAVWRLKERLNERNLPFTIERSPGAYGGWYRLVRKQGDEP